jgi:hypothetical protein
MKMADSMKGLTKDILSSSEERTEDITELKDQTKTLQQEAVKMVKNFSAARDKTSKQLKKDLEQSNASIKEEVKQSRENAQSMIQGFHDSRRKNGDMLRKELAQSNKLLVQNEKKRQEEVGNMMTGFQKARAETSAELKKDLAEGQAKMRTGVKAALEDARSMMNDFQSSHQKMAAGLKNNLEKGREERQKDVGEMRKGFLKVQKDVQDDLRESSIAWKEMSSTIHTKGSGRRAEKEVQAETPPNLEEKLLAIINRHSEGITLSEVANELGIVTIVLGKAARVLLEQGKVRKEAKSYFPVNP